MPTLRLILDNASSGPWNMAVDEALLESAAETGRSTLRFYGWSPPTLSLGYFQPYADRLAHVGSRDCAVVRRCTGGGAILHHEELTYSLVIPTSQLPGRERVGACRELYAVFHETAAEALAKLGIAAGPAGNSPSLGDPEPFLCFARRTADDVVCGGKKLLGSAQRRVAGGLLQHGSLLWKTSPLAPELEGVCSLLGGQSVRQEEFREVWLSLLSRRLNASFFPERLEDNERNRAEWWLAERYGNPRWTQRR